MSTMETLDLIEQVLDKGSNMPFTNKIAVDADAIRTYIGNIRMDLPVEIEKAQEVLEHYNSILRKASTEASVTTSSAQKQADELIETAKIKAKEIIDNADANAAAKISAAEDHARRLVEETSVAHAAQEFSDRVRSQATAQAEATIRNAQAQADALLQDAQNKADSITQNAKEWSANIRIATNKFVSDIMKNSDDVLSANIAEIRKARQSLQAAISDK